MKLCVAGSRTITGAYGHRLVRTAIRRALEEWDLSRDDITEAVTGMADGPDLIWRSIAEIWGIPPKEFPAAWDNLDVPGAIIRTRRDGTKYNANAGKDRNKVMAEYADRVICVWNGTSGGTADMMGHCRRLGKPLYLLTDNR